MALYPTRTKKQKYCSRKCFFRKIEGKGNPLWKGDKVGMKGLHQWIYRRLGRPKICMFCNGVKKNFHWANKSGRYLRQLDDWLRLCVSCHKKYDLKRKLYESAFRIL